MKNDLTKNEKETEVGGEECSFISDLTEMLER